MSRPDSSSNRRQFLTSSFGLLTAGLKAGRAREFPRSERLQMGVQTNAWGVPIRSYSELLRILEILARLQYRGFETNVKTLQPYFEQAPTSRKDFEARQVRLIALHSSAVLYDRSKVASEIERLRPIAARSAQMGAGDIIISDGNLPRQDGKLAPDAVRVWTEGLNRLGKAVQAEGVRLCYHNHRREFEGHPTEMSFLLRETDPRLVWLNFDVGHPVGLIKPADFSAKHFRRIAIYHLKDVKTPHEGKPVYTRFGEGDVNLKGVVAPLLNSDWEGWLEVEEEEFYPNPLLDPERVLEQNREYLRAITGV